VADIDILIVSWNVSALLGSCLRSILAQAGAGAPEFDGMPLGEHRIRVHVIDNGSVDGTVQAVREQFPWVHLLASERNLGFTGGNNLGLQHATGEYILLLNPDTELDPNAVGAMLHALQTHAHAGVAGPRLLYADGQPQPSRRRFPTLTMALFESTVLERWFPHNRWARAYRMEDVPDDRMQTVDWLTGACLFTRRMVWDQIGPLDDRFFMYSEELDWCRRAADAGWECLYVPEAHVVHHEGQSSGQVVARRRYLFSTSKVLYWEKHHGRAQARLLRRFLVLTFVSQLIVESLKWLLGHKRELRRERIAAYRWLIGTGLRRPSGIDEETP
jgi:N-acetylglucosaminyl-diphospho-decaprenol L-rhamnosyltransferase